MAVGTAKKTKTNNNNNNSTSTDTRTDGAPTRMMFWTRKRRMMTSSSAVRDSSSTVMGPNCCRPGSGQYCRQGWKGKVGRGEVSHGALVPLTIREDRGLGEGGVEAR